MLYLLAFISGILTLLSPCVIPMIPIIFGSSLSGNRYAKYLVLASLGVSIFIFTFLLKTSLGFFSIDEEVLPFLSSGILIVVGISLIFPQIYSYFLEKLGLGNRAQKLMQESAHVHGFLKYITIGAALGPLFGSCSPTYALILALILPVSPLQGILALLVYILGFLLALLISILLGQRFFTGKDYLKNPRSYFYKILGGIIVLSSLLILSGAAFKVEYVFGKFTGNYVSQIEGDLLEYFPEPQPLSPQNQEVPVFPLDIPAPVNTCSSDRCEREGIEYSGDIIGQLAPSIPEDQAQIGQGEMPQIGQGLVLIDFWTAGCVNCVIALEKLESILDNEVNSNVGLISIHSPELQRFSERGALQEEVERLGIEHPVYMDNDFELFRSYKARYWPTVFLVDESGRVRYSFEGIHELDNLQSAIDSLR